MNRIVHGLPLTPIRLLEPLRGSSFCVSFARPDQIEEAIDLVGDEEILILDNGAFSIWRAQVEGRALPERLTFDSAAAYREAFWAWANEIQDRCPQAVAVIPDVIEGSARDNLLELTWALREGLADYPDRTMAIWHMDDDFEQLVTMARICNFVGIGSCAEYDVQRNRVGYHERLEAAREVLAEVRTAHRRAPWIHLMRGLGQLHAASWVESADSSNVARNHHRLKKQGWGDLRALEFDRRVTAKVGDNIPGQGPVAECSNFDAASSSDTDHARQARATRHDALAQFDDHAAA